MYFFKIFLGKKENIFVFFFKYFWKQGDQPEFFKNIFKDNETKMQ